VKNSHTTHYDKQFGKLVVVCWNSITEEQLGGLLNEMQSRCQAVIDANGILVHTWF
jgi:hypothetical protein